MMIGLPGRLVRGALVGLAGVVLLSCAKCAYDHHQQSIGAAKAAVREAERERVAAVAAAKVATRAKDSALREWSRAKAMLDSQVARARAERPKVTQLADSAGRVAARALADTGRTQDTAYRNVAGLLESCAQRLTATLARNDSLARSAEVLTAKTITVFVVDSSLVRAHRDQIAALEKANAALSRQVKAGTGWFRLPSVPIVGVIVAGTVVVTKALLSR